MNNTIVHHANYQEIAQNLLDRFHEIIKTKGSVSVAVSGGSTPLKIFEYWRDAAFQEWQHITIFWVDERAVPMESEENNYGNAARIFGKNKDFPQSILVPMPTEGANLAERYQAVLEKHRSPIDIILLGIGDDGHTASIFPGQNSLLESPERVALSENPYSGQQRITLTGPELLRCPEVYFIATGEAKRTIIRDISNPENKEKFPASFIYLTHRNAKILTDILN